MEHTLAGSTERERSYGRHESANATQGWSRQGRKERDDDFGSFVDEGGLYWCIVIFAG